MSTRLRVAVIGAGAMGARHARVYHDLVDAELVAVVDASAVRAAAVGLDFAVPFYTDYLKMAERERPDAVSVAVPTSGHFGITSQLLEAGCHVLVEKPIAATLAEARALVAAADAARRVLRVGHIERFNPAIVELRRRITAGNVGRVLKLHARRLGPYPARVRDVGVALDLATHDLDLMRWLTGSEAVVVTAVAEQRQNHHHEDWLSGAIRFADDSLGVIEASWLATAPLRELVVAAQDGSFRLDYLTQSLCYSDRSAERGAVEISVTRGEPLKAELVEFLRASRGESAADGVRGADGADGMASVGLALALLAAGDVGGLLTDVVPSAN